MLQRDGAAVGRRPETLTSALRQELHLIAAWIADHRQRSLQPRQPWPDPPPDPPAGWPLIELTHLSAPPGSDLVRRVDLPADALAQAEALGLVVVSRGGHRPGRWQLTAMHGVFAVGDRPRDGQPPAVFLGDDGTRLLDTVLNVVPRGTVLDVGCGAGLATAGAARSADHVHGFDIVPACVEAARTSAQLTDVAHKVTVTHDDLFAFQPDRPVDCIIANVPGVPVPQGLGYIPAGYGGDDGLALTRHLLDHLPAWTRHRRTGHADAPVLVMRLQSPGDPEGPFALNHLRALATATRLDISVVTDSRINADVRNSLTTKYATHSNPDIPEADIAHAVRSHAHQLGMTHYYSSSVTARPGNGRLKHLDLAIPDRLNTTLHIEPPASTGALQQAIGRYFARLARLPMGFWELGHNGHIESPATHAHELVTLINQGQTPAEAIRQTFAPEFTATPTTALAHYSTTGLLIETLLDNS